MDPRDRARDFWALDLPRRCPNSFVAYELLQASYDFFSMNIALDIFGATFKLRTGQPYKPALPSYSLHVGPPSACCTIDAAAHHYHLTTGSDSIRLVC